MNRTLLQKELMYSATERCTYKDQEQDMTFLTRHRVITEGYTGGWDKDKPMLGSDISTIYFLQFSAANQ